MIICAALLVQVQGLDHTTILPCYRHGFGYKILKDLGYAPKTTYKVLTEGFITHTGEFLNRYQALRHAKDCGQLNVTTMWYKEDHNQDELYSEDLY